MPYNARNPKWTWWVGVCTDSVIRLFFTGSDKYRDEAVLRRVRDGEHLLVTAFAKPSGSLAWRQGLFELSRDEVVFYSLFPLPRRITNWESGKWRTRVRKPERGDHLALRLGFPRTTILECEDDSESFQIAATPIDFGVLRAIFSETSDPEAPHV